MVARGPPKAKVVGSSPISVAEDSLFAFEMVLSLFELYEDEDDEDGGAWWCTWVHVFWSTVGSRLPAFGIWELIAIKSCTW
jgi:hypothetical protein